MPVLAPERRSPIGIWMTEPSTVWRMKTTTRIANVRQKQPWVSRQLRRRPAALPGPSTTIAWAKRVLRTAISGSETTQATTSPIAGRMPNGPARVLTATPATIAALTPATIRSSSRMAPSSAPPRRSAAA